MRPSRLTLPLSGLAPPVGNESTTLRYVPTERRLTLKRNHTLLLAFSVSSRSLKVYMITEHTTGNPIENRTSTPQAAYEKAPWSVVPHSKLTSAAR